MTSVCASIQLAIRFALHADLTMLAQLGLTLTRARAVPPRRGSRPTWHSWRVRQPAEDEEKPWYYWQLRQLDPRTTVGEWVYAEYRIIVSVWRDIRDFAKWLAKPFRKSIR